jgi:selenocysteine-specific elongation factor
MGVPVAATPVAGDWLVDPAWWRRQPVRLQEMVEAHARDRPLDPALPVETLRRPLGLPDRSLVAPLVAPPLMAADGRVGLLASGPSGPAALPGPVRHAVAQVRADLARHPFRAPEAGRLAALGLGPRELAAAARAGALVRLAGGIVLSPPAVADAARLLDLESRASRAMARRSPVRPTPYRIEENHGGPMSGDGVLTVPSCRALPLGSRS